MPVTKSFYFSVRSLLGSPSALCDKTNPDWAPTQNMGHHKIKNSKIACDRNARAKERGIKRKRAEVAAQTYCIEEPCNVELNEKPDKETTEQPYGTQINIIHHNIFLTIYLRFTEKKKITIIPVFM